jgi:hypothetical protein
MLGARVSSRTPIVQDKDYQTMYSAGVIDLGLGHDKTEEVLHLCSSIVITRSNQAAWHTYSARVWDN